VPRADRDRDRPARSARLAVPDAIAEQRSPAGRRHRRPGARDRAPRLRTRATCPRTSPGPAGRIYGDARSTQRRTSSRNTATGAARGRPREADGAHRPS
jgi:hypothetical protein